MVWDELNPAVSIKKKFEYRKKDYCPNLTEFFQLALDSDQDDAKKDNNFDIFLSNVFFLPTI